MFLHGYLSNKESFYYQTEYFKNFYRVTVFDFLGFGASSALSSPYSVGDYAEWFLSLMRRLKIKSAFAVAHSFGARVALKAANIEPEFFKKLVITGGAGIVKPRSKEYLKKVAAYRRVKKFFPAFAERHFGSEEYRSLSPVMKESYKKIVNEDLRSAAKGLNCKTLLYYGKEDKITPPNEEGEIFHSLIKDSVLRLSAGGHFCFSEHSAEFNERVKNFLAEE